MLTNHIDDTSRPPPPAKVRRASAKSTPGPPPPYVASSRSSASIDVVDWDKIRHEMQLSSPVTADRLSDRSCGNLAQLLLKADEVIKERENDMGVTSAARKSLREDSLVLMNKHEEFLRRISSPSRSRSLSAITSPVNSPLPSTPHHYSAGQSQLSLKPDNNETLLYSPRTRKISVSQNDIALLSDQNAELLSKLEKLESDSAQADLAGRRKLRKLEREIQSLREELEQTQVRSEELEEKVKLGFDPQKVSDEMWKKKMDHQDKIRTLRGKRESDTVNEVRDFAPGSTAIPGGSSIYSPFRPVRPSASLTAFHFPKPPVRPVGYDDQDDVSSAQPRTPEPERELAVTAQLLLKIRELEEANAQITDQQAQTAVTLHSVQKDAESIRRVYEGLSGTEGIEWEIVADEDSDVGKCDKKLAGSETIRFQSFRRGLDDAISRPTDDFFADDIRGNMQSTVNHTALSRIISNHNARKPVVGLFDSPQTSNLPSSQTTHLLVPSATDADSTCTGWSTNDALHSPTLSALSIAAPSPDHNRGATLGSELGSEFGDDWGVKAGNHHLKGTSLYQFSRPSTPSSPIPTSSLIQVVEISNNVTPEPSEPQAPVHSVLQPLQDQSTPSKANVSRRRHQTEGYQRLSQTIRSRTTQWADGQFKGTLLSFKNDSGQLAGLAETEDRVTSVQQRLAGVFDSVVGKVVGPEMQEVAPPEDEDSQKTIVKVDISSTDASPSGKDAKGVQYVILELWLWLRFFIIILVFLWDMAKRGPKSVLGEAERRISATRR